MTKWHKGIDRFTIKIGYDKHGRARAAVPAPLIDLFGKPAKMTIKLERGQVILEFD